MTAREKEPVIGIAVVAGGRSPLLVFDLYRHFLTIMNRTTTTTVPTFHCHLQPTTTTLDTIVCHSSASPPSLIQYSIPPIGGNHIIPQSFLHLPIITPSPCRYHHRHHTQVGPITCHRMDLLPALQILMTKGTIITKFNESYCFCCNNYGNHYS